MGRKTLETMINLRKQVYIQGDEIYGQVILEISEQLKVKSKTNKASA